MKSENKKKIIRTIKIDADRCNGCRACEVICSSIHAVPKHSSSNPARSRIRVNRHPFRDIYVPVFAGEYFDSECPARNSYTISGKEYPECAFCRAACPSREEFMEPDSGLPLKCDMCEGENEPQCVKYCHAEALIYEEREEDTDAETNESDELTANLQALAELYGMDSVRKAFEKRSE